MQTPQPDPNLTAITQQAKTLGISAGFKVTSPIAYADAADTLMTIKALRKQVEDRRTEITKPINEGLRRVNAMAKAADDPLAAAERYVKNAMASFQAAEEAKRREEQRLANERAQRERERIEREAAEAQARAKAKADADMKAAEDARAAGDLDAALKLDLRAERTLERADQRVEILESRAATVVAPVIESTAPKVAGIGVRERWLFEVTDAALVPREYLMVDEKCVRRYVEAMKRNATIPGVRIWRETGISAAAK